MKHFFELVNLKMLLLWMSKICDQVISKCFSHDSRRKLLEKGKTSTLQQLREIARVMEDSKKQACKMEVQRATNEVRE